jgi:hypothetical protein
MALTHHIRQQITPLLRLKEYRLHSSVYQGESYVAPIFPLPTMTLVLKLSLDRKYGTSTKNIVKLTNLVHSLPEQLPSLKTSVFL